MTIKSYSYIINDSRFRDLVLRLDICSTKSKGCENCKLLADCQKFFDLLSARALDKVLKKEDAEWFEMQYHAFCKQLPLLEVIL